MLSVNGVKKRDPNSNTPTQQAVLPVPPPAAIPALLSKSGENVVSPIKLPIVELTDSVRSNRLIDDSPSLDSGSCFNNPNMHPVLSNKPMRKNVKMVIHRSGELIPEKLIIIERCVGNTGVLISP